MKRRKKKFNFNIVWELLFLPFLAFMILYFIFKIPWTIAGLVGLGVLVILAIIDLNTYYRKSHRDKEVKDNIQYDNYDDENK